LLREVLEKENEIMATVQEAIDNAVREAGETRTQYEAIVAMLVAFRARVEELLANAATPEQAAAIQSVADELDAAQASAQGELDKPVP
jgi:hypothetical protein